MKIVIREDGTLELERAGKMRRQYCPFAADHPSCGDWCPHFGEPSLTLGLTCGGCGRTLVGDIKDRRKATS
jgi:hypothetical protein